ncbi:hypothetical protein ABKV19_022781 [Rosa sericea]
MSPSPVTPTFVPQTHNNEDTTNPSSPPPISDVSVQKEVLRSEAALSSLIDKLEMLCQPPSVIGTEEVSLASLGRNPDEECRRDDAVVPKGTTNGVNLASTPELYPELVSLNTVLSNLNLLSHDSTDIAIEAVQFLQDLTDEDTVDENDEPTKVVVDVLVDTNEPNGATYRQSSPQIGGPYWMSLRSVAIPASGITAPLECHPFSVVRIDECLSSLDFVPIVEKNEKFSSRSPAMNSVSCLETIEDAEEMFLKMPERNIVLWNTLISALVQIGQEEKAMAIFDAMVSEGVVPPNSTLEKMEVVDKEVEKGCALLCMYSKCGKIKLEKNVYLINDYGDSVSLLELDIKTGPSDQSGLNFVSGIICKSKALMFERMLFHGTRGNMFLNQAPADEHIMDPLSTEMFEQIVFLVFSGLQAKAKILKICEAFGTNCYPIPENITKRRQITREVSSHLAELETTLDAGIHHRNKVLILIMGYIRPPDDFKFDDHKCDLQRIFIEPLIAFYSRYIDMQPSLGRYDDSHAKVSSTVLNEEEYMFVTVVNVCTALVFKYCSIGIVEVSEKWFLGVMNMNFETMIGKLKCGVEEALHMNFLENHTELFERCLGYVKSTLDAFHMMQKLGFKPNYQNCLQLFSPYVNVFVVREASTSMNSHIIEVMSLAFELLVHQHMWLRCISSRLVLIASVTESCSRNSKIPFGTYYLIKPNKLFIIAVYLCYQLKTQLIDDVANKLITQPAFNEILDIFQSSYLSGGIVVSSDMHDLDDSAFNDNAGNFLPDDTFGIMVRNANLFHEYMNVLAKMLFRSVSKEGVSSNVSLMDTIVAALCGKGIDSIEFHVKMDGVGISFLFWLLAFTNTKFKREAASIIQSLAYHIDDQMVAWNVIHALMYEEGFIIEFFEKPKDMKLEALIDATINSRIDDLNTQETPYLATVDIYVLYRKVMFHMLQAKFSKAAVIQGAAYIRLRVKAYMVGGCYKDIAHSWLSKFPAVQFCSLSDDAHTLGLLLIDRASAFLLIKVTQIVHTANIGFELCTGLKMMYSKLLVMPLPVISAIVSLIEYLYCWNVDSSMTELESVIIENGGVENVHKWGWYKLQIVADATVGADYFLQAATAQELAAPIASLTIVQFVRSTLTMVMIQLVINVMNSSFLLVKRIIATAAYSAPLAAFQTLHDNYTAIAKVGVYNAHGEVGSSLCFLATITTGMRACRILILIMGYFVLWALFSYSYHGLFCLVGFVGPCLHVIFLGRGPYSGIVTIRLNCETIDGAKWFGHLTLFKICPTLRCLPDNGLPTSLQRLQINFCPALRCLPDSGLPSSVSYLDIYGCPLLEKRCQRETGEDRPKIAYIV